MNHTPDQCWKLHPHLKPKSAKAKARAKAQAARRVAAASVQNTSNKQTNNKTTAAGAHDKGKGGGGKGGQGGKGDHPPCAHCGRTNHASDQCFGRPGGPGWPPPKGGKGKEKGKPNGGGGGYGGLAPPPVVLDLLGWVTAHTQSASSSSGGGNDRGRLCGVGIHLELHVPASSSCTWCRPKGHKSNDGWLARAGLLRDRGAVLNAALQKAKDGLMQKARERVPLCPPQPPWDTVQAAEDRSRAASTSPRGRRMRGPGMTSLLGMMTLMSCAGPAMPYSVPGCTRPVFADSGCTTNVFDQNDPTLSRRWKTGDQPMDTLGGKALANKRGKASCK